MKTKKVLFVIDMLKDFIDKDGALYCGPTAEEIVPFVKKKVDEYHANGDTIYYICDSHDEDDKEFERFPKHCVDETPGADIIDELKFMPVNDYFIPKTRFSGFYGTGLDIFIDNDAFDCELEVEVVGVCTSICVLHTVTGLCNMDIKTIVHKEGVADFNQEAHTFALKYMEDILGANVV